MTLRGPSQTPQQQPGSLDDKQFAKHTFTWGRRRQTRAEDVILALEIDDLSFSVSSSPKYIDKYLVGETLGEGSFGKVKEAIDCDSLCMWRF